jgi:hypothetical protein
MSSNKTCTIRRYVHSKPPLDNSGLILVIYLTDFNYFPLEENCQKSAGHSQNRSKIDNLKGSVYGLSYFSWFSLILFSKQNHPCDINVDTSICDKICKWLEAGRWFSPVSSTTKTDRHDITEILLKVALSTINPKPHFVRWLYITKYLDNNVSERYIVGKYIIYLYEPFSPILQMVTVFKRGRHRGHQ